MARRHPNHSEATIHLHPALDGVGCGDEEATDALITTGALVALADGRADKVERDEFTKFVTRRGFVSQALAADLGRVFDDRLEQLADLSSTKVIVKTLRPFVGESLAPVIVRTAEKVAAADRTLHPGELRTLDVIRRVMKSPPI